MIGSRFVSVGDTREQERTGLETESMGIDWADADRVKRERMRQLVREIRDDKDRKREDGMSEQVKKLNRQLITEVREQFGVDI